MALSQTIISQLGTIFHHDQLFTETANCWPYGYDNSKLHSPPDAVVLPTHHQQVVDCVQLCNQHNIPLTARGRGTGTTGASVPTHNGIVISLERMNKIISFNQGNLSIRVQTGITNQVLQDYLHERGFFWAPDPSSASYCSVGGNLACNAAGPRAVKYGTTRDNTLQLKAVTGNGESINTGSITSKGVVGYDLTRLLIGSEGTLAIITEAELKILPLAQHTKTLRVLYSDTHGACVAIEKLTALRERPAAIEFMDHHAIQLINQHTDVLLAKTAQACLMINIEGSTSSLINSFNEIEQALQHESLIEIQQAETQAEKTKLWTARKALSPILRTIAPNKINEDIVIPIPNLAEFIRQVDTLSDQHQLPIVNFGHAGNGNLHVNIMYDANNEIENKHAQSCLKAIFALTIELNGTLSGEHGIGITKRDFMAMELGQDEINLMHAIKAQFDRNNILNPDKSLPMATIK
jgi:D-lactate dehydrogenase